MRASQSLVWQGTLALMVVVAACVGGQPGAGAPPARPAALVVRAAPTASPAPDAAAESTAPRQGVR